ncbi:MAG: ribosomal RNA small subunit methyltransferase A [Candidatus Eisenbacteria bacterium]|nr:ribosomal RNA small subunit methyltransferase A [Candidatus Eisenbacteria bacterium]
MTRKPNLGSRPSQASSYIRERAQRETEVGEARRVKDVLAARGLSPRKRFGQNFLIQPDLCQRIADHCHLREDDIAVEIGPGAGALTNRIASRVQKLIAVEKDMGLAEYLREEFAEHPRVEIVEGDFLEFSLTAVAEKHGVNKIAVVGNIPYNITTPILERLFEQRAVVRSAVLLVQKEYAQRLAAAAGSPEYGALTLFARYHALLEPLMTLKAASFWPRPDVDSMLVRVMIREKPPVEAPEKLLFRIIRASFQQRRKQLTSTLANALGRESEFVAAVGAQANIDLKRRGETLTLEEFARLARAVDSRGHVIADDLGLDGADDEDGR